MCQQLPPRRQAKTAMSKRFNCAESGDVKDYTFLGFNLEWLQEKKLDKSILYQKIFIHDALPLGTLLPC